MIVVNDVFTCKENVVVLDKIHPTLHMYTDFDSVVNVK